MVTGSEKQMKWYEEILKEAYDYLERSMRKLIREQRRLSRKRKDSHNREKQRIKVARVHEKVTNQRNDFLQKQSTMLVRENQTICIEDLNVKGMIRNHKLAKPIASVSWAKFFEMLEYKAIWYGNEIRRVPTMYPNKDKKLYRRAYGNRINIACGHCVRHCSTVKYSSMQ